MEPFRVISGVAAPILIDGIDTDIIIPVRRMLGAPASVYAKYAFEPLRFDLDENPNPDFILNRPGYEHPAIILGAAKFGVGSSREMAVWALMETGVRCVIAESFGEIFKDNCFRNGVLAVELSKDRIQQLADAATSSTPPPHLTVSLEDKRIDGPGGISIAFSVADDRRHALLEGLDDIALTLTHKPGIDAFQQRDRERRPWIYRTDAHA